LSTVPLKQRELEQGDAVAIPAAGGSPLIDDTADGRPARLNTHKF